MAIMPFSTTTGVAASRLFPDALSRTLQTLSEELDRAFAAAHRFDELRTGQGTGSPLGDRGRRARQVFVDLYAGK